MAINNQFIKYGLGGKVPTYATAADLPVIAVHGDLAVTLDTNVIYEYDGSTWLVLSGPTSVLALGTLDSQPKTANGGTISSNTLYLQSADVTYPGLVNNTTQDFSGVKTLVDGLKTNSFDAKVLSDTLAIGATNASIINIGRVGATINIQGTTLYENVTQLQVTDPLITLNKGGGAGSAANSGIELEENSLITGYVETSSDRNSWQLKAPNTAGVATITPGASGITLNQSSHDPLTLAAVGSSPNANGASLSAQALTLQPASVSFPGVVSTTTQSFAGDKNFAGRLASHLASPTRQIEFVLDSADLFLVDGTTNPRTDTFGALRIHQTPTIIGTRGIDIEVTASGFGDTHSIVSNFFTGAFTTATQAAVNLVTVDGTNSTGGTINCYTADVSNNGSLNLVNALKVNPGVAAVFQITGAFSATSKTWYFKNSNSSYTDVTTGTNQIFIGNSDILYVSKAASTFTDVNIILSINAGSSILPTFQYWNGSAWTAFTPTDTTNGFSQNGNINFVAANLTGWTTTTVNGTNGYWIRITRTRAGGGGGPPTMSNIQLTSGANYTWNATGDVAVNSLNLASLTASRAIVTDASKTLMSSATTATQIGYLSTTTSDVQTQLDAKIAKSVLTTAGDIIYASAPSAPARLGLGTNGYVLTANTGSNAPTWTAVGGIPTQTISGNTTWSTPTTITDGALITVNTGVTLTIDTTLTAGAYQIFTGPGTVVFGTKFEGTVYPEWFGAVGDGSTDDYTAINKAVVSLAGTRGVVLFGAKTYKMGTVVTISSSNLILRGAGNWATRILTTGASQSAFQFTGVSSASKINHNGVEDMFIYKNVTATGGVGILLSHTSVANLKNLQVADFGIGVQLANATNTLVSNVTCTNSAGSFNFIGFYADGTDPNGNVSSKFADCSVDGAGNSGTSIGFYNVSTAAGGNINDVYYSNCATASCYTGYKVDGSNQLSDAWGDIIIDNPIVDFFTDYGILIANTPVGSGLTIKGGWINPKPLGTDTISMYIFQSNGITIDSTQFFCDPTTTRGTYGIKLDTSTDVSMRGCLFYDYKYGIYGTAANYCAVVGNKFYSANTFTTSHIHLTSTSSYFTITSNILDGYGTNGILFDTLTTLNRAFNNSINTGLITNPLVDNNAGSNNQFSIGNAIATAPLTINRTTNGTNTSAITGTKLHIMSLDSVINGTLQDSFGTINQIIGRRAQGTSASPTTLVNTAIMLRLGGQGRDDTGYNATTAVSMDLLAEGTWSTTSLPTGISFKTTTASSTTLTERMRITNAGNIILGQQAALATNATNGFTYIPSCAGTPTGVPTAFTGMIPIVADSTNNKLYIYSGGAWVALN